MEYGSACNPELWLRRILRRWLDIRLDWNQLQHLHLLFFTESKSLASERGIFMNIHAKIKNRKLVAATALAIGLVAGSAAASSTLAPRLVGSDDRTRLLPTFGRNDDGQTFGSLKGVLDLDAPDLIQAVASDGTEGFVLKTDLIEPLPADPQEAVRLSEVKRSDRTIPLYDRSGKNILGWFVVHRNSQAIQKTASK